MKQWPPFTLKFLLLAACASSCASMSGSRKPSALSLDKPGKQIQWQSPACTDFLQFSVQKIDQDHGFNTDGLVILKDGEILYEFYDGDPRYGGSEKGGLYRQDTPHCLWSASKTITATLVARAIYDGIKTPTGAPLTLQTPLNDILTAKNVYGPFGFIPDPITPNTELNALPKRPYDYTYAGHYYNITIENLVAMSSGFRWYESYETSLMDSTFLPMLYEKQGNSDMLSYSIRMPIDRSGPNVRWNYSSGNTMILSGVLWKLHDKQTYARLPWILLFDRLGMKNAVFERDGRGMFIGNSYTYLRPLDMARFGQVFLQDGTFNGERLMDAQWIKDALQLSPTTKNPETTVAYIKDEGVYGARSFWLNQQVQGYGPEFPASPADMYFAAGHYGQLIIILPSQKMVIARTGHDLEYWSKIDALTSKAISCFTQGVQP